MVKENTCGRRSLGITKQRKMSFRNADGWRFFGTHQAVESLNQGHSVLRLELGGAAGIDRLGAAVYGFTDEELDFIPSSRLRTGMNYDIKYRMGRDVEVDDE